MVESKDAPDWLRDVVVDGLMSFVVLGLPRQPPAETIALTGEVWIKALWQHSKVWNEDQDRIRIEQAFLILLPLLESWPVPKDLLAAMPPRPEPVRLLLSAPVITPKQRETNLKWVRQIKAQLKGLATQMGMPKHEFKTAAQVQKELEARK